MRTSNFARHGSDPNAVAISLGVPKWFKGRVYKALAPTGDMIHLTDEAKYTRLYYERVLNRLDAKKVAADLGPDAILLCWEKPGDFCHRRLVAEWLYVNAGIKVPEAATAALEEAQTRLF